MNDCKRKIVLTLMLWVAALTCMAASLVGTVVDTKTREPLIGAMITFKDMPQKTVTDINGQFEVNGLKSGGRYMMFVSYVGYKTKHVAIVPEQVSKDRGGLVVEMDPDEHQLNEVSVVAVERHNTETAAVQQLKNSDVIESNVSAQEIEKTQDSNAGEVIRRVPGVSLIDDKFVMVRGLSQRYNNVWMNGGAVPSSEADSRAFSFDIIPSQQIDNLTIVKTPDAEYPADYTGGFILINTKEIPVSNMLKLNVGLNINDATVGNFSTFHSSAVPLSRIGTNLLDGGFNNDWHVRHIHVLGDGKVGVNGSYRWTIAGHKIGLIASVNYSSAYRTYKNMQNNLFGVYDVLKNQSNYLRQSIDDQYNRNDRLGSMLNITMLSPTGKNKYELKNIFNYLTTKRYTWRDGYSAQSNQEQSAEYYYRSRAVYNGQMKGKHTFSNDVLDWSVGYAFANRLLPDRHRYMVNDAYERGVMALYTGNDISREWTQLYEHIVSANINNKRELTLGKWKPSVKFGGYGEYRTRDYEAREFIYDWTPGNNHLPADFKHMNIPSLLSNADNLGPHKLDIIELVDWTNNYSGNVLLGAGYLTASLPFGALTVLAGVRFEHDDMTLTSNIRVNEKSPSSRHYRSDDFFPSLNATYKFTPKSQVRLCYGRSINRPEFREVSSSVFYDFDLASNVQGNPELKMCKVDNLDLRYEYYPSRGESISLAAFYKHFSLPIEWTYTVAGGTDLIYSFENAQSANNFGLELDIRKDLSFIGLRNLSWSFNGSLIHSRVKFPSGSKEENRPMQGQSPYLINTGLFYRNDDWKLNVAVLYNRIGKRIIGVGRSEGVSGSAADETARVPDSYEMPRNVLDLSVSKRFGQHWELKLYARDILAEKVFYKQYAQIHTDNGKYGTIEEIVRSYRPGRNIGLSLSCKL